MNNRGQVSVWLWLRHGTLLPSALQDIRSARLETRQLLASTMRSPTVLAVILLVVVVTASPRPQQQTAGRLDNVNVAEVVKNDRLLTNYIKCMLEANDNKCTAEGKELKKALPRIVNTGCGDCTDSQRASAELVLKKITKDRPEDWKKLRAKFDPSGQSAKQYGEYWRSRGVSI